MGLHPRNSCIYIDYLLFADPGETEGWVGPKTDVLTTEQRCQQRPIVMFKHASAMDDSYEEIWNKQVLENSWMQRFCHILHNDTIIFWLWQIHKPTVTVPPVRLSTVGSRAFPVAVAQIWKSIPEHIVSAPTLPSFRRHLKKFLLQQSFCLLHFSGPCSGFSYLGHFRKSLIDWLTEPQTHVIMTSGITISSTNCDSSPRTACRFFSRWFIATDCCWSVWISELMLLRSVWNPFSICSILYI